MNSTHLLRSEPKVGTGFRILVLEHHALLAAGMQRFLEVLGHQVEVAVSLGGAWVALGARPFDVLISDVYLPQGLCLNLLQGAHPRLPRFIATMSGFDLDADILRDVPVRRHLVKPFDPEELEELLEEWAEEQASSQAPEEGGGW